LLRVDQNFSPIFHKAIYTLNKKTQKKKGARVAEGELKPENRGGGELVPDFDFRFRTTEATVHVNLSTAVIS